MKATQPFYSLFIIFLNMLTLTPSLNFAQSDFDGFFWSTAAMYPYHNSEAQSATVNGKWYVFGGFDKLKKCCTPTDRAYVFDPVLNKWNAIASMPPMNFTGHGGVTHAGFTTDGTDIYFAGGYTSNGSATGQIFGTKEVWKYSPASNTYSRMPNLPIERAAGALVFLNGKLHYMGGTNKPRTMDVGEHYVLDLSNTALGWQTLAPLPNPRHHSGAVVFGGKIYYVGGQHGHDSKLVTDNDVHVYDPLTDTWSQVADMPKALSHISGATIVFGNRIIVLGGEIKHGTHVSDVYAYTPTTNTWTSLTPLPTERSSGVATELGGIVYYATGRSGRINYTGTPFATNNLLYEAENHYSILQDMGSNVIKTGSGDVQSALKDVRMHDLNDKIRLTFKTYRAGMYALELRVRSGNSSNPTIYLTGNHYLTTLNGNGISFTPNLTDLSPLSTSYGGGAYLGSLHLSSTYLTEGTHFLDVQNTRTWAGVDFLRVKYIEQTNATMLWSGTSITDSESELEVYPESEIEEDHHPEEGRLRVLCVYPNPVRSTNLLKVDVSKPLVGKAVYTITDFTGKELNIGYAILEGDAGLEVDLSKLNLKQGLYYLKVRFPEEPEMTLRFMKQ